MVVKRKTAEAWKKKQWFTIVAPKMFEEKEVGTTLTDDPEKMMNRVIFVPLSDITFNVQHQFMKLRLRVTRTAGKNAYTDFDGFELVREYVRRNIRRGKTLITLVREVRTKDGHKLQLTAHVFTTQKIKTAAKQGSRSLLANALDKACDKPYEETVQRLVFGTVASELFKVLKEAIPVRRVEVSKCELVHD